MTEHIQSAAVLGAGQMGTAIAAQLASLGIKTYLLDMVPKDASDDAKSRNQLALSAIEKALKSKPATFLNQDASHLITPGNFEDNLTWLNSCDLVVEAIIENLDLKKKLFAKITPHLASHTILASNTSGLSLAAMSADLSEDLQQRTCVMHFFNPVRYMRLLEVVRGPKTSDQTFAKAQQIGELLGKGVVEAKDTSNFIANRIGTYALLHTISEFTNLGLTIEQVDKISGPAMARPKTGTFKLADMIGLDTIAHVAKNCYDTLTEDDQRNTFILPDWIQKLISAGALGRKAGAGFYKKNGSDILVYDIEKTDYRPSAKVRFDSLGSTKDIEDPGQRVKALIQHDDPAAQFAWKSLAHTLIYSAKRIPEVSDHITSIDESLRWGFNWDLGPFELWDAIGVEESVARMQKEGLDVPKSVLQMLESGRKSFYETQSYWSLSDNKATEQKPNPQHLELVHIKKDSSKVVSKNLGASLVDIGDDVLCLEVHTKMNTIDDDVIHLLQQSVDVAEKDFKALVIANDGQHFGAGANIMLIMMAAQSQDWAIIDKMIVTLQDSLQRLKYSKIPVIAAPFSLTLGGCAELAMATDACQAHAETYMGLVEVGAGLIPGGGGCLRMVQRWTDAIQDVEGALMLPSIATASLNIATAKVSTGAYEAKKLRLLRDVDGITLDRRLLLHHAKQKALGMANCGYIPPIAPKIKAAGFDVAKTIEQNIWGMTESGYATEHDAVVARKLIHILVGGYVAPGTECTEQHYLDLEREAFLSLCGEEKTMARIQNLLMTGKPLRN